MNLSDVASRGANFLEAGNEARRTQAQLDNSFYSTRNALQEIIRKYQREQQAQDINAVENSYKYYVSSLAPVSDPATGQITYKPTADWKQTLAMFGHGNPDAVEKPDVSAYSARLAAQEQQAGMQNASETIGLLDKAAPLLGLGSLVEPQYAPGFVGPPEAPRLKNAQESRHDLISLGVPKSVVDRMQDDTLLAMRDQVLERMKEQAAKQGADLAHVNAETRSLDALTHLRGVQEQLTNTRRERLENLSPSGLAGHAAKFGLKPGEYLSFYKQFQKEWTGPQPDPLMDPDGWKLWSDRAQAGPDLSEFDGWMGSRMGLNPTDTRPDIAPRPLSPQLMSGHQVGMAPSAPAPPAPQEAPRQRPKGTLVAVQGGFIYNPAGSQ